MDHFQIVKLIGKGTFGRVYKVKNTIDKRSYALKKIYVLRQKKYDNLGTLTELHILYHNKCPFLLQLIDCHYSYYDLNIITKFCVKGDLGKEIETRFKTLNYFLEDDIWKIFIQICYGIHYLHKNNIIHRDLKTANIFLEKDNNIRIGDFGISKILKQDLTNTSMGTPLYLSPEVINRENYGLKTDLWALGCILYELAMLKYTFSSYNMNSLMKKINNCKYVKISNPIYSSSIQNIVDLLIVKDSLKRIDIDQLLKENIIVEKQQLCGYYDINNIEGNEIPALDNVPLSLISWGNIIDKYKTQKKYIRKQSIADIKPKLKPELKPIKNKEMKELKSRISLNNMNYKDRYRKYSCLPPVLSKKNTNQNYVFKNNIYGQNRNIYGGNILMKIGSKHDHIYKNSFFKAKN